MLYITRIELLQVNFLRLFAKIDAFWDLVMR